MFCLYSLYYFSISFHYFFLPVLRNPLYHLSLSSLFFSSSVSKPLVSALSLSLSLSLMHFIITWFSFSGSYIEFRVCSNMLLVLFFFTLPFAGMLSLCVFLNEILSCKLHEFHLLYLCSMKSLNSKLKPAIICCFFAKDI